MSLPAARHSRSTTSPRTSSSDTRSVPVLPSRSSTLRTKARSSTAVTVRPRSRFRALALLLTINSRSRRQGRGRLDGLARVDRCPQGRLPQASVRIDSSPALPPSPLLTHSIWQLDGRVATNQGAQGRTRHPLDHSYPRCSRLVSFSAVPASCFSACLVSPLILHCTVVWIRNSS